MTSPAVISRHYEAREPPWESLAAQGFRRIRQASRNGRWIRRGGRHDHGFRVEVWLANAQGFRADESVS
jgi:hypothetical protein